MSEGRTWHVGILNAVPFVGLALAGARPLHDVPGHAWIGVVLFAVGLASLLRLGGFVVADARHPDRTLALAGLLFAAPWLLILLLWTGLGAPFQASTPENQQRYVLLMVDAILVGAGFMVLRDALRERSERFWCAAAFASAVLASGLYLACIALTVAQSTMALQGDHTPMPPVLSHLYDALEFFACSLTYLATALAALAMCDAGLLGRTGARVFVGLCSVILLLLVLRGIEYPDISGQSAPWYTQPGVIVRIPAMAWILPGLLAVRLVRAAGSRGQASA